MLTKPFARYGKAGDGVRRCPLRLRPDHRPRGVPDARSADGPDGPEWHYAFAGRLALTGLVEGRQVWGLPHPPVRASNPIETFYFREEALERTERRKP